MIASKRRVAAAECLSAYKPFARGRPLQISCGVPVTGRAVVLHKMLQAKLHRVRVTHADLHYEGSCGIDELLLEASGLRVFQHIDVYNITNGARFSTYVIRAPRDSGQISLNGAAARLAMVGDQLIICGFSQYSDAELERYRPLIVLVDEHNRPRAQRGGDQAGS